MTTPATKIVIVAGQEFSVPTETDNEAIRGQLAGMGFADVASATIQTGKKQVGDVEYDTIEFVKKAGTKGLGDAELAELLGQVERTPLYQPAMSRGAQAVLRRFVDGELTYDEALTMDVLEHALIAVENHGREE